MYCLLRLSHAQSLLYHVPSRSQCLLCWQPCMSAPPPRLTSCPMSSLMPPPPVLPLLQLDDGLADALEAELARLHGELSASALRIRSVKDELQETQEELARVKEAHHRLRDTVRCDRV